MLPKHAVLNLFLWLTLALMPTAADMGHQARIPPGQLASPSQCTRDPLQQMAPVSLNDEVGGNCGGEKAEKPGGHGETCNHK